jgi:Protein of unknown function (DUF3105)
MPKPAALAAACVALGLLFAGGCSGGDEARALTPELIAEGGQSQDVGPADEGIDGVEAIRVYYSVPAHVGLEDDVPYDRHPPAGGMHAPIWWNCGFYDTPVRDENAVHDLEHGVVWLAYSPDLDPKEVDVLQDIVRDNDKVLAAPYGGLDEGVAVVATAWARQLTLDSVDDPRLDAFVEQYQDGDQAPEAGASCSGSPYGQPIP